MKHLFAVPKGIVPALDTTDIEKIMDVVQATANIEGVVGYKIGMLAGLGYSLAGVVECIREKAPEKHLVYDHQKGGTDIPDLGKRLSKLMSDSGVDSVILFPQSGPATQEAWTKALQECGIEVWIGGHMTHPKYLVADGGYIDDGAPERIYRLGAEMGVRKYIVPGNKPELVASYRSFIADTIKDDNFTLGAPGFVKQGGSITEAAKAAGDKWVAIVGSAILDKETPEAMRQATLELVSQLG